MTILVFGKTGQVARELQLRAPAVAVGRDEADLTNIDSCLRALEAHKPALVINAAAYTAVDKAETEDELANQVNGHAPTAIAGACTKSDIPMVHISTDYVFDGSGSQPWKPDDQTAPRSAYGRSKRLGEKGVLDSGGNHAILRTSWVFSAHGQNFVKTMLRLGAERDSLSIVADQIGGPTSSAAIAQACLEIGTQLQGSSPKSGIYHFSGSPDVSWADFAREIFAQSGTQCAVHDIPSSEYPTPAERPFNSRLDCSSLAETFGIERPDWRADLNDVLQSLQTDQEK